jgi:hypothetical protein
MTKDGFTLFCAAGERLLHRYGVRPPLHMKEFSQIGLRPEMKTAFLTDVAFTINRYKFFRLNIVTWCPLEPKRPSCHLTDSPFLVQ